MPRMTTQPRAIKTFKINQSSGRLDLFEALDLADRQIDHFDPPADLVPSDLMPAWHIFQPQD